MNFANFTKYDKFFLKIPNIRDIIENIYTKRVRNIENQCANFAAWNDNLNSTAACENAGAFDPVIHANKKIMRRKKLWKHCFRP